MDKPTVDIYEQHATEWARRRPPVYRARAADLGRRALPGLPIGDLGCGPGVYLGDLGPAAVALDAAASMLVLARRQRPAVAAVQADLEALPLRDAALGGAWASNSYLHVPRERLPVALAHLHRAMAVGAPLAISFVAGEGEGAWADDDFPGRYFTYWRPDTLADILTGAGFAVVGAVVDSERVWAEAVRARTLADTVSAGMRVLVCGLNPSVVAADAGYAYAGPTNRFWPAALAAGLVTRPRDQLGCLRDDAVGITDLVKRATPNAALVSVEEYRAGADRLRRLVEWLRPGIVLFVGLAGWRAAIDSGARAGLQTELFGGVRAYVMPSTSGLNAHSRLADLCKHMDDACALASSA